MSLVDTLVSIKLRVDQPFGSLCLTSEGFLPAADSRIARHACVFHVSHLRPTHENSGGRRSRGRGDDKEEPLYRTVRASRHLRGGQSLAGEVRLGRPPWHNTVVTRAGGTHVGPTPEQSRLPHCWLPSAAVSMEPWIADSTNAHPHSLPRPAPRLQPPPPRSLIFAPRVVQAHPKARHSCWAWRGLGDDHRFSDDGEPGACTYQLRQRGARPA